MSPSKSAGEVQAVLGNIPPDNLGVTLTHEHVFIHFKPLSLEPEEGSRKGLAMKPVTIDDVGWIRGNWAMNYENLGLYDEELMMKEVTRFYRAGGQSLVDATNRGIGRDPLALARVSRATGLNIVMGSGYYLESFQPAGWTEIDEDRMMEEIVEDVTEGVGDTGVRSGIIGEIGCSWPWTETERRSVRAGARAQVKTGAPLLIHPGRHPSAPLEIVRGIEAAGGDVSRTIMSHVCRTISDYPTLKELADTGCYIEYDLFGAEQAFYPLAQSFTMPNDGTRVDNIIRLIEDGHLNQVVVAHDTAWKTRLHSYGGHGYAHLLENVVPIMRGKGMSREQIDAIFVENPKRVLQFL